MYNILLILVLVLCITNKRMFPSINLVDVWSKIKRFFGIIKALFRKGGNNIASHNIGVSSNKKQTKKIDINTHDIRCISLLSINIYPFIKNK